MKSRIAIACLAACLCAAGIAVPAAAQQSPSLTIVSDADYSPPGNHRLQVHSAKIGRDFMITVTTPPAYGAYVGMPSAQTGRKLPVIYALDGGYGVAGSVVQMMTGAGITSPAYVVSIAYVDGQPNMRNTDFLHHPTDQDGKTIGGGGAAFQAFLTDELRPLLEARYPFDPDKAILFGHSFGGLFAANVIADKPDAFFAYIVGSPSVWADATLIERLKKVASKGDGRRVFVAVGGVEQPRMVDGANQVAAVLGGKGSTFKVEKRIFAGEGHINYYPQLAPAAFEWLLPPGANRVAVTLPEAAQQRVVGDYLISDGRVVGITHKDGKVFIQITGVPGTAELQAESAQHYFLPGLDVTVTFEGAPTSQATGLVFTIGGTETHAARKAP